MSMSSLSTILCTNFKLNAPTEMIEKLIDLHMGDYSLNIDKHDDGSFSLDMPGGSEEVGESYSGRIECLVKSMQPYVLDGFSITLREDTMRDERDMEFFGGPTEEIADDFRCKTRIKEALELLDGVGVKHAMTLDSAMKSRNDKSLKNPQVFITIEGGVVQGVTGSQAVDVVVMDYDIDSEDDVKEDFQGAECRVIEFNVSISQQACNELNQQFGVNGFEAQPQVNAERQK